MALSFVTTGAYMMRTDLELFQVRASDLVVTRSPGRSNIGFISKTPASSVLTMEPNTTMRVVRDLEHILHNPLTGDPQPVIEALNKLLKLVADVLAKYDGLCAALSHRLIKRTPGTESRRLKAPIFRATTHDSPDHRQLFERLLGNPALFWDLGPTGRQRSARQVALLKDPFYSGLLSCLEADSRHTHEVLHYRLSCLIIAIFKKVYPQVYSSDNLLKSLANAGIIEDDEEGMQSRIDTIVRRGKGLFCVAQQLGLGSIWCIATDVWHSAYVSWAAWSFRH